MLIFQFREAIEKAKSGTMPESKQNAQTPTKNKSIRIKEDKEKKDENVDFIQVRCSFLKSEIWIILARLS